VQRRTELWLIIALIAATVISFVAFGVDTLGIIILSMALVCLGLFAANPGGD
jgi:hypothetical protein